MAKLVSTPTMDLIKLGDNVIGDVKTLLPYGAGNQSFDRTRTKDGSAVRTYLAQTTLAKSFAESDWTRPLRNAGAALKFGAGNCQEQAAVAYALLRERLGGKAFACYVQSSTYKHVFATIGDPVNDPASSVVVVDPWPEFAQAVLWADHFTSDKPVIVLKKGAGGASGKLEKARQKYAQIGKGDVDRAVIMGFFDVQAPPPYGHQYCAKGNVMIEYTDDLLTF